MRTFLYLKKASDDFKFLSNRRSFTQLDYNIPIESLYQTCAKSCQTQTVHLQSKNVFMWFILNSMVVVQSIYTVHELLSSFRMF